jgi:hypothetical protein
MKMAAQRRRSLSRLALNMRSLGVVYEKHFVIACRLSGRLRAILVLASEANLLLFNDVPPIYRTRYSGDSWRTQKDLWGSWHKPNTTDRHHRCFDVQYRSNEVGARDSSFAYKKAGSEDRYVLLGDSFAEGYGVNFADTAQAQLERLLGIDVYNFGSAGYFGPVQYYLIYKELASQYQHDGIILFFLPANDFTDNDYSLWKDFRWPIRHILSGWSYSNGSLRR